MSESSGGLQTASEAGGEPPSPKGEPTSPKRPTAALTGSSPHPDQQSSGGSETQLGFLALPPITDQLPPPDEKRPIQETTVRPSGGSKDEMTSVTETKDKDDELFFDAQDNVGSINGSEPVSDVPKLQKGKMEEQGSKREIQEEEKRLQGEQKKPPVEVSKSAQSQISVVTDTEGHPLSEFERQRVGGTDGRVCAPEAQVKE